MGGGSNVGGAVIIETVDTIVDGFTDVVIGGVTSTVRGCVLHGDVRGGFPLGGFLGVVFVVLRVCVLQVAGGFDALAVHACNNITICLLYIENTQKILHIGTPAIFKTQVLMNYNDRYQTYIKKFRLSSP